MAGAYRNRPGSVIEWLRLLPKYVPNVSQQYLNVARLRPWRVLPQLQACEPPDDPEDRKTGDDELNDGVDETPQIQRRGTGFLRVGANMTALPPMHIYSTIHT